MKIRNGFISNSSSSSFVVAFPSMPESEKELCQWMFGDEEFHNYLNQSDGMYKTSDIAEIVMKNIKKTTKSEITDTIRRGWFPGYKDLPGYYNNWDEVRKIDFNKEPEKWQAKVQEGEQENLKRSQAIAKKFMTENTGAFFCTFSYSDNDGYFGAMMEHSKIFNKLSHIQINCH
jgi:hypothetical protein